MCTYNLLTKPLPDPFEHQVAKSKDVMLPDDDDEACRSPRLASPESFLAEFWGFGFIKELGVSSLGCIPPMV